MFNYLKRNYTYINAKDFQPAKLHSASFNGSLLCQVWKYTFDIFFSFQIIDLKAELFRKQEEFKKQKLQNQSVNVIRGKAVEKVSAILISARFLETEKF